MNTPLIEIALTEVYGERCQEPEPGCPCCKAWHELDTLKWSLDLQKLNTLDQVNKLDLMADEFERIAAIPDVSNEIKQLCERSAQDIKQSTPLIQQRDFALKRLKEESALLDWVEKQASLALWQGSFADSPLNIQLGRVGAPICTVSTMDADGLESNDDRIGEGGSFREAIAAAIAAQY